LTIKWDYLQNAEVYKKKQMLAIINTPFPLTLFEDTFKKLVRQSSSDQSFGMSIYKHEKDVESYPGYCLEYWQVGTASTIYSRTLTETEEDELSIYLRELSKIKTKTRLFILNHRAKTKKIYFL
jgi:hypothetical protein